MIYSAFVIGIIFGSFLNVVIYRLNPAPQLRGGVFGSRSICPNCKVVLKWYDLFPILSFLFLRGHCRYCDKKISWQYPIVEILSGLIWVAVFYKFFGELGLAVPADLSAIALASVEALAKAGDFFYYIFIFSSLLVIAVYDYKWQIIPDKILFPTIFIALIYNFFQSLNFEIFKSSSFYFFEFLNIETFVSSLIVSTVAFLFFFSIYFFSKGKAMGFGDAKLAFLIGLILNTISSVAAFTLAFIIGALFGIILLIFTEKTLKSQIAFGPFLIIGMAISFFFSDPLIRLFN